MPVMVFHRLSRVHIWSNNAPRQQIIGRHIIYSAKASRHIRKDPEKVKKDEKTAFRNRNRGFRSEDLLGYLAENFDVLALDVC